MDLLIRVDVQLFRLINEKGRCPLLDWLMPVVSDLRTFAYPLLVAAILLAFWGARRGRSLILSSLVALALSDLLASHLVREFFARTRPCAALEGVNLLVSCRHSFSFPSAHASNISACALLAALHYPRWRHPALLIALLVGYSRVYLGVHYPADVAGGYLLGATVGMLVYALFLGYLEDAGVSNQPNRSRIRPFR